MYENIHVYSMLYVCGDGNCGALLSHLGAITKVAEAGNTSFVKNNPP